MDRRHCFAKLALVAPELVNQQNAGHLTWFQNGWAGGPIKKGLRKKSGHERSMNKGGEES